MKLVEMWNRNSYKTLLSWDGGSIVKGHADMGKQFADDTSDQDYDDALFAIGTLIAAVDPSNQDVKIELIQSVTPRESMKPFVEHRFAELLDEVEAGASILSREAIERGRRLWEFLLEDYGLAPRN